MSAVGVVVLGVLAWPGGASKRAAEPIKERSSTTGASTSSVPPTTRPPETRDPFLWPYSADSIWNTPIGSEARYVPARIVPPAHVGSDRVLVHRLRATDPLRPVYLVQNWIGPRCVGREPTGLSLELPDDLVIPDTDPRPGRGYHVPNNAAAFVLPDGHTVVQLNAVARCTPGGPLFGVPCGYGCEREGQDLYAAGTYGGRGGSGLSALGGVIRAGELPGPNPIRHVLAVNLWARRYYYYGNGRKGFRWPAVTADSYASGDYGGRDLALALGSLLAVPRGVTATTLGLESEPGRKLFHALQDYGAYAVDDTYWDSVDFPIEDRAVEEFRAATGSEFGVDGSPFRRDIDRILRALAVVDDNAPGNVGGAGQRLAPPPPALRDPTPSR